MGSIFSFPESHVMFEDEGGLAEEGPGIEGPPGTLISGIAGDDGEARASGEEVPAGREPEGHGLVILVKGK